MVDDNWTADKTMNGFFLSAIVARLKFFKRRHIDAKFTAMADDADYQNEAMAISEEFGQSDSESLDLAERGAYVPGREDAWY
ncbi:MAG: hypothetical protein WB780_00280 [Candidatus Acidiferrales bacterium]